MPCILRSDLHYLYLNRAFCKHHQHDYTATDAMDIGYYIPTDYNIVLFELFHYCRTGMIILTGMHSAVDVSPTAASNNCLATIPQPYT